MEFKWFEDFISLARTGNFSRAAEERNVTQPAFSRRIKALETWLGTPLVDRSTYPTQLTPAGRAFRDTAEEIIRTLYEVRDEFRTEARATEDTVSFTAQHSLSLHYFPGWMTELEHRLGTVPSRLRADNMHNCVQALTSGDSDFLLCFSHRCFPLLLDPHRFQYLILDQERLLPVCAPDAEQAPLFRLPGTRRKPLPYLAYAPDSFLGRSIELMLQNHQKRVHLQRHYENSLAEALKMMALAGRGLAWIPRRSVRDKLRSGHLVRAGTSDWEIPLQIRLYRTQAPSRPIVETIWEHLSEGEGSRSPSAEPQRRRSRRQDSGARLNDRPP